MVTPDKIGPFLWLNPEKKEQGDYCIHIYYEISQLGQKMVNVREHEVYGYSLYRYYYTDIPYLGDSDPVAYGITAYLACHLTFEEREQKTPRDDNDFYSLFERIWGGMEYDIYDWYEKYWRSQFSIAEKLNNKKTLSQGHLPSKDLMDKFYNEHIEKEDRLFKLSEGFFSTPVLYSAPEHREELKQIALNYLQWVKDNHKPDGLQVERGSSAFICILDEGRLNEICDNLIKQTLIPKYDKQAFLALFSSDEKQKIRWNDKIRGAKSALFDMMYRLTGRTIYSSELKDSFVANDAIHDKDLHYASKVDKIPKQTKLMDRIFKA